VRAANWASVAVPELGCGTVQVVQWLVSPGTVVAAGDRLAELLAGGVLFHLAADVDGVLVEVCRDRGAAASTGETLAWIETAATR